MSYFCYNDFGDSMIAFLWNNIKFKITDIGGGALGEDIPRHAHAKNSYELHFIINGKGNLITDTREYNLKSGNFFVTGPNIYHSQTADKENPVEDVFITIQAEDAGKPNAVSGVFLDTCFCFYDYFENETAKEILKEYREKRIDYTTAVSALCTKLLTDISRLYLPPAFEKNTAAENLNDRRFVIIEQSFLYNPDISLRELSDKIGVCERQTQRLLKKYYSKSFREKKREISVKQK